MTVLTSNTPEKTRSLSNSRQDSWLVGPSFDLILVANVAWPLIALIAWYGSRETLQTLQFWQVYFVTTPHRWITLAIVFLDRNRFQQRRWTFLGVAIIALTLCAAIRIETNTLTCLLLVDYLWNAWHFASQHHGVWRIYCRRGTEISDSFGTLRKFLMRGSLFYVALRLLGGTWQYPELIQWASITDAACILCILGLMLESWVVTLASGNIEMSRLPQNIYMTSVAILFSSMLAASHLEARRIIVALVTASALFHATEYLAITSWSVRSKPPSYLATSGAIRIFASHCGLAMVYYVILFGTSCWFVSTNWMNTWLFLNVVVAFLHYAYDGLIWKQKGAQT